MKQPIADSMQAFYSILSSMQLSEASLQVIRDKTSLVQVRSNALLVQPGSVCTHLYFVLQGSFVCRYISQSGDAKIINFYLNDLHPFMACVDSYFSQVPTHCELRAVEDSTVLTLSKKEIDALAERDENLRNFYISMIIQALIEENDLKLKIIAYSSDELYQYILQYLPVVIQKVPSKYIAEFMGISAEWLSKLRAKKR